MLSVRVSQSHRICHCVLPGQTQICAQNQTIIHEKPGLCISLQMSKPFYTKSDMTASCKIFRKRKKLTFEKNFECHQRRVLLHQDSPHFFPPRQKTRMSVLWKIMIITMSVVVNCSEFRNRIKMEPDSFLLHFEITQSI